MNDVLIKAKFYSLRILLSLLLMFLIVVSTIVASINYIIYSWKCDAFETKAIKSVQSLCLEIQTYFCDSYDTWGKSGRFSTNSVEDLAIHDTELKFANSKLVIDEQEYIISNAGELWWEERIPYDTLVFNHEAPSTLMDALMKQYKANYFKSGVGHTLLLFSFLFLLAIVAFYIAIIIIFVLLSYNHLIVTKECIYAKSTLGKKNEIPLSSVIEISKIGLGGLAITSLSETKKILFIKNRDEIVSSLSTKRTINTEETELPELSEMDKIENAGDITSNKKSGENTLRLPKGLIYLIVGAFVGFFVILFLGVIFLIAKKNTSLSPKNTSTTVSSNTTAVSAVEMTTSTVITSVETNNAATPKASDVKLSKREFFLEAGETDIAIIQRYPDADTGESDEIWTSMDSSIAVVNASGYITGVSKGQTYIILSFKNHPDIEIELKVSVTDAEPRENPTTSKPTASDVRLSKREFFLDVGETDVCIVQNYPEKDMKESDAVWKSLDPTIAVVNSSGYVTGVSKGQTYIILSFKKYPDIEIALKVNVGVIDAQLQE